MVSAQYMGTGCERRPSGARPISMHCRHINLRITPWDAAAQPPPPHDPRSMSWSRWEPSACRCKPTRADAGVQGGGMLGEAGDPAVPRDESAALHCVRHR